MGNVPIYPRNVSLESLSTAGKAGEKKLDREKLKKACTDFESIMISQLLKSMRQTMAPSGLTGNGLGKGIYDSLFDQEVSRSLAKRGGLGLGKMIYNRVIRQEEKKGPIPPGGRPDKA
jgi:peptidoglycan hydrolase FlgJ